MIVSDFATCAEKFNLNEVRVLVFLKSVHDSVHFKCVTKGKTLLCTKKMDNFLLKELRGGARFFQCNIIMQNFPIITKKIYCNILAEKKLAIGVE